MVRKVYDSLRNEAHIVFVLDQVYFLLIIHDKERLRHLFFCIILDVFPVGLEGYKPRPCQLKYLLLCNLV